MVALGHGGFSGDCGGAQGGYVGLGMGFEKEHDVGLGLVFEVMYEVAALGWV